MAKSNLTVRIDNQTKKATRELAKEAGLTVSAFVDLQLQRAAQNQSEADPEFKPEVARDLDEAIANARAGRNMAGPFKTVDELMAALEQDDD